MIISNYFTVVYEINNVIISLSISDQLVLRNIYIQNQNGVLIATHSAMHKNDEFSLQGVSKDSDIRICLMMSPIFSSF